MKTETDSIRHSLPKSNLLSTGYSHSSVFERWMNVHDKKHLRRLPRVMPEEGIQAALRLGELVYWASTMRGGRAMAWCFIHPDHGRTTVYGYVDNGEHEVTMTECGPDIVSGLTPQRCIERRVHRCLEVLLYSKKLV